MNFARLGFGLMGLGLSIAIIWYAGYSAGEADYPETPWGAFVLLAALFIFAIGCGLCLKTVIDVAAR